MDTYFEDDEYFEGGKALRIAIAEDKKWERPWPRRLIYEHKHGAKNAALFLEQRRPRRIICSGGVFYSLSKSGLWRELSEQALEAEIRATDPTHHLDTHEVEKMVKAIRHETFTHATPFEWIEPRPKDPRPEDMMLFQNGRFDFKQERLAPHNARYFATGAPSFDYDPRAGCPVWKRCLGEWLDPSLHDTLHEFAGYLMVSDTRLEKMLVLVGTARSGKSTIARVLGWLCGKSHMISRSLDDLGGDFGLQGCLDKRMMLIPDAHDTDVKKRSSALARIKAIVGQDEVSVNGKYAEIATGAVPVRIVMTANRHPSFIDESGALSLRELLLTFGNSFAGREDRDLSTKLESELSGIANLAIEGLRRLRSNSNRFTVGSLMEEYTTQLRRDQSPALDFATDRLKVTGNLDGDFIPDAPLFELYTDWCKEKGITGRLRRSLNNLKADLVAALGTKVRITQRRLSRDRYGRNLPASVKSHGLAGVKRPFLTAGYDTPSVNAKFPIL